MKELTIYEGVNESVFSLVPSSAVRILDLGCGTGELGERLRQQRERFVLGITYSEEEVRFANSRLSQVIFAELNGYDFSALGKFDCVIMSHILEHLHSPEGVLQRLRGVLESKSVIVVALPNVVWWQQRIHFLLGRWRYKASGILDRTHFRFFDLRSSRELLEQAGYEIIRVRYDGAYVITGQLRRLLDPFATLMNNLLCKLAPGLFASQFVYLARVVE